jgi:hypothetical protein
MARYFARIVRALIVNTLGFGGGCGLLVFIFTLVLKQKTDPHALQFGLQASLQAGLQAGLVIGLMSSFILVAVCVLIDLTTHLFLAKGLYKEIWELEQTRDVVAAGTVKEVMQATRQALLTVPNIKNVSDDVEHLITRASTGASWRSPGEEMEVEINPIQENTWKLKCTSRSSTKNAVFDYGKNYENVEVWQKNVHEILKSGATPA